MKFSQIQKVAMQWKFTGDLNDETAVRNFVADQIDAGKVLQVRQGDKITTVTRALVCRQDSDSQVTVMDGNISDEERAVAQKDENEDVSIKKEERAFHADIEARVNTLVAEQVRKLGLVKAEGRPEPIRESDVSVRSASEVVYEIAKANGSARFSTYRAARDFQLYMQHQVGLNPGANGELRPEERAQVRSAREELVKRGVLDKDFTTRTYATFPNQAGGALTNVSFIADLIKNINDYGAAVADAMQVTMTQERAIIPKHAGTFLPVAYPDENGTSSSVRNDFSNVTLQAKTAVVASKVSRQILQDANIDITMQIADDFARALARQEEQMLFVGDGTAATPTSSVINFVGVKGLAQLFLDNQATPGTFASCNHTILGASTQDAHTLTQLNSLMALLPQYARPNAKWYVTPEFVARVFDRLGAAAGGTRWDLLEQKGYTQTFLGRPIVLVNSLNSTNAASANVIGAVDAIFGDLSRAAIVGRRAEIEIKTDESVGFLDNAIWMRAVYRHDIKVHEPTNGNNRAPVVCLAQA